VVHWMWQLQWLDMDQRSATVWDSGLHSVACVLMVVLVGIHTQNSYHSPVVWYSGMLYCTYLFWEGVHVQIGIKFHVYHGGS